MQPKPNRRQFLGTTALSGLSLTSLAIGAADPKPPGNKRPIVITSGNLRTVEIAMEMIKKGADPLDAVIAGVAIVEADPNDHSVGLGGTPNEDGVVELDASVMHGRTHGGAGVAGLRNIMHPAAVARTIMKKTRHVLLVGDNALKFAKEQGFPETDLLDRGDAQGVARLERRTVPGLSLSDSAGSARAGGPRPGRAARARYDPLLGD